MSYFKKAAIIGTGLIGGSLALEIKRRGLAGEVVGVSRKARNILLAKKIGAIDRGSTSLDIIRGADLVVFATSVGSIIDLAAKVSRLVPKGALVTDVGSTKEEITAKLSALFPYFVGGHPLAGSEKRSITAAQKGLFKNAICILTPLRTTNPSALGKIKSLWSAVGAKVIVMDSREHDRLLSFISHLPHAVAFSLINSIPDRYVLLGSAGLKDTTRIAGSDPALWAEIFLSNQKNVAHALRSMESQIKKMRHAVTLGSYKKLVRFLSQAKKKRETLR